MWLAQAIQLENNRAGIQIQIPLTLRRKFGVTWAIVHVNLLKFVHKTLFPSELNQA